MVALNDVLQRQVPFETPPSPSSPVSWRPSCSRREAPGSFQARAPSTPRIRMTTSLTTRKPVDELTAADLEAFPVWEYADDEEGDDEDQDETWVRPVACDVL